MSNIDTIIEELNSKFSNLNTTSKGEFDDLISKLTINVQTIASYEPLNSTSTLSLLLHIKNLITNGGEIGPYEFDDEVVFQLLSSLLKVCKFEIVAKVFSRSDVLEALQSELPSLFSISCNVLAQSNGSYIDKKVYLTLITTYFDPNADISIITSIEAVYRQLSRELSNEMLHETLPELRNSEDISKDNILFPRLLELFNIFFIYTDEQFNFGMFFEYDLIQLIDNDIVNFIHYTKFIINVLHIIQSAFPSKTYLVSYVTPLLLKYGEVFANMNTLYIDVKYFAKTNLFQLFKNVSFIDQDIMKSIDEKYLKLNNEAPYFMDFSAFLNPVYLLAEHRDSLDECLEVSPKYLASFRNLISNEKKSFDILIKKHLTGKIQMPYTEQLVLVEKLTQYEYSAEFLLMHCAKLSSVLIDNKDLNETEAKNLKEASLRKLLSYEGEFVQIWRAPLVNSLKLLTGQSVHEAKVLIEEVTL